MLNPVREGGDWRLKWFDFDFPDFVDIYPICQPSAVLPDISFISLSIGSYLELAIFREDFSSVVSVNVGFSWVFCFVFICCYKLNLPHNEMRTGPGLFSLRAFLTFRSHDFSHGCLYVESSEGGRRRLNRFVTVVAWKFLKISCYLWILLNRFLNVFLFACSRLLLTRDTLCTGFWTQNNPPIIKKNNILIVNTFFQSFMLKVMNVYSILITDK